MQPTRSKEIHVSRDKMKQVIKAYRFNPTTKEQSRGALSQATQGKKQEPLLPMLLQQRMSPSKG